jgi:hypothetical protein
MSRQSSGPVIKVRALEDLASALPYLLGFQPRESLVLTALGGRRQEELTFTMRLDLPDPAAVEEIVTMCAHRMAAAKAASVVAFIVTDRPGNDGQLPYAELPYAELVEALQRGLPMVLRDALLVADDRVWSFLCPEPQCCPPAGRPLDRDSVVATSMAAAQVMSGRPLRAERDDVVRSAHALGGGTRESMLDAVARVLRLDELDGLDELDVMDELSDFVDADDGPWPVADVDIDVPRDRLVADYSALLPAVLGRADAGVLELSHDEAALLGCGWHVVDLRDALLTAIARGERGAEAVVRAVARLMPAPYDAPAATMLGWVAYSAGSGVLANAALERALDTNPDYSLAHLLGDALFAQVPPSALADVWTRFAQDEVCHRRPARAPKGRGRRSAREG